MPELKWRLEPKAGEIWLCRFPEDGAFLARTFHYCLVIKVWPHPDSTEASPKFVALVVYGTSKRTDDHEVVGGEFKIDQYRDRDAYGIAGLKKTTKFILGKHAYVDWNSMVIAEEEPRGRLDALGIKRFKSALQHATTLGTEMERKE